MPQLHVETGDGQERAVELGERPVAFGRADDNDVVLTEPKASRRHCTFRPVRGGWRVVDEQSSNGTWLGGKPVLSARLQPGDEVEIGDTVITFAAEPSAAPAPRVRRPRKVALPWGALVAAGVLATVCFVGSSALAGQQRARASAAWKRVALAGVEEASLAKDADTYQASLRRVLGQLELAPEAEDAKKIVLAAQLRGLAPPGPAPRTPGARRPDWQRALDELEAARARHSAAERRTRLRDALSRFAGDGQAVETISAVLRSDEAAARERALGEAARLLADADQAAADGRYGVAIDDWTAWAAIAPDLTRDEERAVAAKMTAVRAKAKDEAAAALAHFQAQLSDGRLAAANASVDAALERLRGTGWDAWLSARTRRRDAAGGGAAVATGPKETDAQRERRLSEERMKRASRAVETLVLKRRFAEASAAMRDAANEETDPPAKAEMTARADDLAAAADVLGKLLEQVREDAARFGAIPAGAGPSAKVAGATDTAVLVADPKGGAARPVGLESLPSGAFVALLDKAKLDAPSYAGAALLLSEVKEPEAYVAWMRRALAADDPTRLAASLVHARTLGKATPVGGYFPHPADARAIVSSDELKAYQNASKIAALTAELVKTVDKVAASKQAKQVETVAAAYAKLEAARNHALELIFDEVKYFYPYRHRMREYTPVKIEVDRRVAAVREAWEDPTKANVRTDAALEKLLKRADDLVTEIGFLGGSVVELEDRVARVRAYLGRELTVQTYFTSDADRALHEYNREILDHNAKLKGGVAEPEREQVRITNEYRRMFGHRRMLRLHEKLVAAARGHSEDMATLGFFDHMNEKNPAKRTPGDRMALAGYPNTPCSENIAVSGDPMSAHQSWIGSSGHHRNILMPHWSELGSGVSGKYWTQNFGFALGDEQAGGVGPEGLAADRAQ